MEKMYINVPEEDIIVENKEMTNALFFMNLHNRAADDESELSDLFKTEFMSVLLRKNKLFHVIEDIVETAVQLSQSYVTEEGPIDIEKILDELVDEGYFMELTD